MSAVRAFASAPGGLEGLLAAELAELGAREVREAPGGASLVAEPATLARVLLWSRIASRVLLTLGEFEGIAGADDLYQAARALPWRELLPAGGKLRVRGHGQGQGIAHSGFAALRVLDAVRDAFRAGGASPPQGAPEDAELTLDLLLDGARAVLSLDLAGESLDRRGWRVASVAAPLKANLAAAMLLRADWPAIAAAGGSLLDPMCGSGTILIEGGLIAADVAPGLGRRFAAERWPGIAPAAWSALRAEAEARRRAGLAALRAPLVGRDADPRAVASARRNAEVAGLPIALEPGALAELVPQPGYGAHGLIALNPPYGERLLPPSRLGPLYVEIGDRLSRFTGFRAVLLAPGERWARLTGLRAERVWRVRNGPIECLLLRTGPLSPAPLSPGAEMLANRLARRARHLARHARRAGVEAYRLYDADLPEYAAVIDRYGEHLHLAEYEPPPEIPEGLALRRLRELLLACRETLGVPLARMHLKQRFPQSRDRQYRAEPGAGARIVVREGELRFLVDLDRYADTGLFLDHRELRRRIGAEAAGKRFLDLFCYTGSATVAALRGGARACTAVDLSRRYLEWLLENLRLNGLDPARVRIVRDDVRAFLARCGERFDLIRLDPPTFSNSKRAPDFDLAREQLALIQAAARLLTPGGTLWFSHHRRGLGLDLEALAAAGIEAEDFGSAVRPFDFPPQAAPVCYRIRWRAGGRPGHSAALPRA